MNMKIIFCCAVAAMSLGWSKISLASENGFESFVWRKFPIIISGHSSISCGRTKDEAIRLAQDKATEIAGAGYVQVGNWISSAYEWEGYYSTGDCLALRGTAYSVFVREVSKNAPYTFTLERSISNPRLQNNDPNAGHDLSNEEAWSKAQKIAEAEIQKLCKSVRSARVIGKSVLLFEHASWHDSFSVRLSATCNL